MFDIFDKKKKSQEKENNQEYQGLERVDRFRESYIFKRLRDGQPKEEPRMFKKIRERLNKND